MYFSKRSSEWPIGSDAVSSRTPRSTPEAPEGRWINNGDLPARHWAEAQASSGIRWCGEVGNPSSVQRADLLRAEGNNSISVVRGALDKYQVAVAIAGLCRIQHTNNLNGRHSQLANQPAPTCHHAVLAHRQEDGGKAGRGLLPVCIPFPFSLSSLSLTN